MDAAAPEQKDELLVGLKSRVHPWTLEETTLYLVNAIDFLTGGATFRVDLICPLPMLLHMSVSIGLLFPIPDCTCFAPLEMSLEARTFHSVSEDVLDAWLSLAPSTMPEVLRCVAGHSVVVSEDTCATCAGPVSVLTCHSHYQNTV